MSWSTLSQTMGPGKEELLELCALGLRDHASLGLKIDLQTDFLRT